MRIVYNVPNEKLLNVSWSKMWTFYSIFYNKKEAGQECDTKSVVSISVLIGLLKL